MNTGFRIVGWGSAVPETILTNAHLEQIVDTSDEWIVERTGIRERRVGAPSTSGLAIEAGRKALDRAGLDGADVDFVVAATITPDRACPGIAAYVQEALGIRGGAMDVNAACSGFAYGLITAHGLILAGARRVLVLGAERLSLVTDYTDRNTAVLFGDGAGALLVEAVQEGGDLLAWDAGCDGSLTHLLYLDHGDFIRMDGKEVFRNAVRAVVESSSKVLKDAGVSAEEIALLVPHQANIRIVQAVCQRLGIPEERAAMVIDRYANTSSASIPLALVDAVDAGRVQPGDLLLLTGFGAGMTWASTVLRWPR
jgi:3-oxoacyl-[acyl-carrier-protein] synthase III